MDVLVNHAEWIVPLRLLFVKFSSELGWAWGLERYKSTD